MSKVLDKQERNWLMQKAKTSPFDIITPVPPGVSWTAPEKSRPWQQPPQLTNISDVAQRYMDMFSNPDVMLNTLDVLEGKIPLSVIAESLMLNNVSEGLHTLDAGILVLPIVIELFVSICILHNIEYTVYPDDVESSTVVPTRIAKLAVKKAMEKIEEAVPVEQPREEKPMGLMARKQKEVV